MVATDGRVRKNLSGSIPVRGTPVTPTGRTREVHMNDFLERICDQLEEGFAASDTCPCCRQSFVPDAGSLTSRTLVHTDDCQLLELRRIVGKIEEAHEALMMAEG